MREQHTQCCKCFIYPAQGSYNYIAFEESTAEKGLIYVQKAEREYLHTIYSKPKNLYELVPRSITLDNFTFELTEQETFAYGATDLTNDRNNCDPLKSKNGFYFCENRGWGKLHPCAFSHLTNTHDKCTF